MIDASAGRVRVVYDPHILGLGIELLLIPDEDVLLVLTVLCWQVELTVLRQEAVS